MYTVSEAVRDLLGKSSLIEEGLLKNIINYSSLARELRPKVSHLVMKNVKTGAIVMALKRHAGKIQQHAKKTEIFDKTPDITVRSNLAEYTFANSSTLASVQSRFFKTTDERSGSRFFIITRGVFETTLIVNVELEKEIRHHFSGESLISSFRSLSAITIRLPEITVTTPGVYGKILRALEWEGINVVEVASTYTEFTLVLNDHDIERAFSAIKKSLA
jgi:aspartokinase